MIGLVTQGLALWEQGKTLKPLEGYTPQKGDRTLAFTVTEGLFQQIKNYLAAHKKLSQKEFVVSLVEKCRLLLGGWRGNGWNSCRGGPAGAV